MSFNARLVCAVAELALLQALTTSANAQASAPTALSDRAVHQILVERIDQQKQSPGIVVGIVTPEGRRVVAHGVADRDDSRPVTGDTVFEIGSVTKVFTSWLLAEMARRGEVGMTDAVARYLPSGATIKATSDGRAITLADLATHTAGMPFWPSNLPPTGDVAAALAGYTVNQLYEFLSSFDTPATIGSKWAYSNIDAGLLGVLLAGHAGTSYEDLLAIRLTRPLGMKSTAVRVSAEARPRLATGHDARLQKAKRWNVPALQGGGSLHSTAEDLLTFLGALGDPNSLVAPSLPTMLGTRRQAPGFQQALGWMMLGAQGDELLFHDGQTLGFASSIAYEPTTRTGVVVLSNAAVGVGDIARHVLRPSIPLAKPQGPAPARTETKVDLEVFDRYAGSYAPAPGMVFVVSREVDSLILEIPGLPKLRLRPETERDFFVAENTRISVTFKVEQSGLVTSLLLAAPTGKTMAVRLK